MLKISHFHNFFDGFLIPNSRFYGKNKDSVNYWIINKEIPPLNYDKSDSIILYINNKAYPIITNGLIGPWILYLLLI